MIPSRQRKFLMRIAVTGGSGKLGRATIRALLAAGHAPVSLDLVRPTEPLCPWSLIDFVDYGQVVEALSAIDWRHDGVDAVVHLAAIAGIGVHSNATTYRNNHLATYNVFHAAHAAGIKNVVWASSETLFGIPISSDPAYLPLDEDSPTVATSSYALAKLSDETIAAQFCLSDRTLKMVGLRLSNVMEPQDYRLFPSYQTDSFARKWNLWAYIDAEDAGDAVVRSLEYDKPGLEIFVVASPDTVMDRSTASLLTEHFPNVPVRQTLGAHQSLQSSAKATRLLGWNPKRSWR
jgi:nucleoside-diphosphate-sugar epimerase